jgi:hypothetical protein
MTTTISGPDIADALRKNGAVPESCFNVQLDISVNKPPIVTYSVFLSTDLAAKLTEAMIAASTAALPADTAPPE